jgi:hypothetical protein
MLEFVEDEAPTAPALSTRTRIVMAVPGTQVRGSTTGSAFPAAPPPPSPSEMTEIWYSSAAVAGM